MTSKAPPGYPTATAVAYGQPPAYAPNGGMAPATVVIVQEAPVGMDMIRTHVPQQATCGACGYVGMTVTQ